MTEPRPPLPPATERRIARAILLTWLGEVALRALAAFWSALSFLLLFIAAWGLGAFDLLPDTLRPWLLPTALIIVSILLWRGARVFAWPTEAEILARIDRDLPGAPLRSLTDDLALGHADPVAHTLWQRHRERAIAAAREAAPVPPPSRMARHDRLGLRLVALALALAALLFGRFDRPLPLPSPPSGTSTAIAAFEGWIIPPPHTGRPTLYLSPDERRPALPPLPGGSTLVLRFYGQPPRIRATVTDEPPRPGKEPGEMRLELAHDGLVRFDPGPGDDVVLDIRVIPDTPPVPRFPEPARRGTGGVFEIPWEAVDDYGVTRARLRIRLDRERLAKRHGLAAPPDDIAPIVIPLDPGLGRPEPDGRKRHGGIARADLSRHLWAGLPVVIFLETTDAAGQSATAEERAVLPRPAFYEPLAVALIEQRRDLLWSKVNRRRVARLLRAITWQPAEGEIRPRAFLILRAAIHALEGSGAREAIADALWRAAELVEHGEAADALARLERAERRLAAALRRGADPAEIADLTRQLQKAMEDYMRALASRQKGKDNRKAGGENTLSLTPEDLAALLKRIEQLSREGRTAEAQALLRQLAELMRNLQIAGSGKNGIPGKEAFEGLQKRLEKQEGIARDTFRSLQKGLPSQDPSGKDALGAGTDPDTLARRQKALRRSLDALEEQLGALGNRADDSRKTIGKAREAMRKSEKALEKGDLESALDAEAEALSGLRESLRSLGEALAGRAGNGKEGMAGRDPLGRRLGGRAAGEGVEVPEGGDARQKSRRIMEEIRRRSSEFDRPRRERRYLRKLIEPFRN